MPHAPSYPLNVTDGVTNDEEFTAKDNGEPVLLTGLVAHLVIRKKKGGGLITEFRSDDANPVIVIDGATVRFTPNFQSALGRYDWPATAWFWIELEDPESLLTPKERRSFVQGPVKVDIGSQIGEVN